MSLLISEATKIYLKCASTLDERVLVCYTSYRTGTTLTQVPSKSNIGD